jgi:hypothetical protein
MNEQMELNSKIAYVRLNSWAGETLHEVEILAENYRTYRVRWIEKAFQHKAGSVSRVPRGCVRFRKSTTAE